MLCFLKVKKIENVKKKFPVEIEIDKKNGVIKIKGTVAIVTDVEDELAKYMRDFQYSRFLDAEADIVAGNVQWFFKVYIFYINSEKNVQVVKHFTWILFHKYQT